jgi:PTH1 family peptidyl-tRNA hydrolase
MASPARLIVGLGNPGSEYERTRHNVGFRALDGLAAVRGARFVEVPKYQAELAEIEDASGKSVLVKPTTFMNKSGEAVGALAQFYKLSPGDIWVVQDDIDLEIGRLRLKLGGGGSGGHNGVKSIEEALGSADFPRLKIGVAPEPADQRARAEARNLVLGSFTDQEEELLLAPVLAGAVLALERMLESGPQKAASMMGA